MSTLTQEQKINEEDQLAIIADVEKNFLKFWDKDFNPEVFKECRDNFALTKDIQSQQILKQNLSKKPRFTIATPTYKRVQELKRALDSALAQDINEEYEILIVENTDANEQTKALEMLEKEYNGRLNYYKNPSNLGLFGNWNRCLELAQGEWVCLLHSDDMIKPNYLSEMKKVVEDERHKDATLIGSATEWLVRPENNNTLEDKLDLYYMEHCSWRNEKVVFMPPSALLHNRQKCLALGGYNSDEYPTGDQTFANRAYLNGKVFTYRSQVLSIRTEEVATSSNPKTQLAFIMIDPQIFRAYVKNTKELKAMQYQQIKFYQNILQKNGYFVICDYVDKLMKQHKIFDSNTSSVYKKIFYPFRQPRKFFKMIFS